jgi:peptide/nickel transport system substrate-binding protein
MLTVQVHQEIQSLHPDDAAPVAHQVVVANVFDGLVEIGTDFEVVPVLAAGYEVSADGLTYTARLREDIQFHDGTPCTARDVRYTFEVYADPQANMTHRSLFQHVASVETLDDATVVIRLHEADAAFLRRVLIAYILPEHHHRALGRAGFATQPIGTGPFSVSEWQPGGPVLLDAHVAYVRGRPHIDRLRIEVVPDAGQRATALLDGRADHSAWALSPQDQMRIMDADGIRTYRVPGLALNHMPLNNDFPPFAEKAVRQALLLAIDRQRLVSVIEYGWAVVATANLSPAVAAFYEPEVAHYPHDPDRARALLDAAGWLPGEQGVREKDGQRLAFTCTVITGDERRRPQAELIQQDFLGIGVEMAIDEAPASTIITQMVRPGVEMQASLFNWSYGGVNGEPDARLSLRSDGPTNFSHYRNGRVDELVDAGLATVDPAQRQAIYREVQRIVADDVPFLFLMFWESVSLWSRRVEGLPESAVNLTALYRRLHTVWVADA